MERKMIVASFLVFVLTNIVFPQQSNPTSNITDLLSGEIQANGLPSGCETAVDNYDCTIKFDENKAIYFERQTIGEKCSFALTREMPNGVYLLKADFKIDGNGKAIMLDGVPLKTRQKITVTDGKLRVGIQTKGGKAWGRIRKMSVSRTE